MSINIYLIAEKMKAYEGFKEEHRSDKGRSWVDLRLNGEFIFQENGRYYVTGSDLQEPISEELAAIIDEVSMYQADVSVYPKRQWGLYAHKSATGTLDLTRGNETPYYSIKIRGKNMADVRELYYLIRSGRILPKESWEAPQIGKPIEESIEEKRVEPSTIKRWFSGLKTFINKF